jgi:hypothetical protein
MPCPTLFCMGKPIRHDVPWQRRPAPSHLIAHLISSEIVSHRESYLIEELTESYSIDKGPDNLRTWSDAGAPCCKSFAPTCFAAESVWTPAFSVVFLLFKNSISASCLLALPAPGASPLPRTVWPFHVFALLRTPPAVLPQQPLVLSLRRSPRPVAALAAFSSIRPLTPAPSSGLPLKTCIRTIVTESISHPPGCLQQQNCPPDRPARRATHRVPSPISPHTAVVAAAPARSDEPGVRSRAADSRQTVCHHTNPGMSVGWQSWKTTRSRGPGTHSVAQVHFMAPP